MKPDRFSNLALAELDALYSTARRWCNQPQEAEDLVQEVYAYAFKNRSSLRDLDRMRVWLHRILHGKFVDHLRRKKRTPTLVSATQPEEYDQLPLLHEGAITPVVPFETVLPEEVERALHDLPEDQRTVLTLREIGELTYDEISEVTGTPVGTVRSRLARARKAMHTALYRFAREQGYLRGREGNRHGSS
jgi:RNA polymerase sigma-70 factor (ECF subfamily)